jgi:hypothetical protein
LRDFGDVVYWLEDGCGTFSPFERSPAAATGPLFAGKSRAFCPRVENSHSARSLKAPQATFSQ